MDFVRSYAESQEKNIELKEEAKRLLLGWIFIIYATRRGYSHLGGL